MTKKSNLKRLKIATVNELKNGQSKKFIVWRKDRETEAFLIKKNEEISEKLVTTLKPWLKN